nr:hypothetical protein [Saliphagus infecundisoli]
MTSLNESSLVKTCKSILNYGSITGLGPFNRIFSVIKRDLRLSFRIDSQTILEMPLHSLVGNEIFFNVTGWRASPFEL